MTIQFSQQSRIRTSLFDYRKKLETEVCLLERSVSKRKENNVKIRQNDIHYILLNFINFEKRKKVLLTIHILPIIYAI